MKKLVYLILLMGCFAMLSCKKDKPNPNGNDNDARAALFGKWRATQQSATVNGQPNGETEYFNGDEAIFEFTGNELKTYNGTDQSSMRIYTWKVVNGELILRERYADSASVYKVSFNGNGTFYLIDKYSSLNDEIIITIVFAKK